MDKTKPARLIVSITGATGTIFGVRLLQMLQGSGVGTHLVVSRWDGSMRKGARRQASDDELDESEKLR